MRAALGVLTTSCASYNVESHTSAKSSTGNAPRFPSPQEPLYVSTAWEKDTQCSQSLPSLRSADEYDRRTPLAVNQVPIKKRKGKTRPARNPCSRSECEYVTPPRLHSLRYGWATGIVQCLCLRWRCRTRKRHAVRCQLHRHADLPRNLACMNSQRPL